MSAPSGALSAAGLIVLQVTPGSARAAAAMNPGVLEVQAIFENTSSGLLAQLLFAGELAGGV